MTTAAVARQPQFTDEQARAVGTRGVSVALSAGAGCGKTFVLTERFLAYFDPRDPRAGRPADLARVVAITFTERAAREMRDRIRHKCHERLLAAKPQDAAYWSELLRGLDNARISTIHSFCASLLRSRAVEAAIDPTFEVLDRAQSDTLLLEVTADELRERLAEGEAVTLDLAARFDLIALADMTRTLVLDCTPDRMGTWLQISPAEQVERWQACFEQRLVQAVEQQIAGSPFARTIREIVREDVSDNRVMRERFQALRQLLDRNALPADPKAMKAYLDDLDANARVLGGGTAKSWTSPHLHAAFRDAAKELRSRIDKAQSLATFDARSAREPAVVAGQLLALAGRVQRRYSVEKQAINALDFGDLLSQATRLLTAPEQHELRARLASQIDLLLVDEFQDTDRQQVELVRALCNEDVAGGKLFFVGDHKQSIYRFRGADPGVFRTLREQTKAKGRQSLTRNFRSQPAILNFVNALFRDELGEDYEALRPERPQVSPTPAVEFLWAPVSGDAKETKDEQRSREADWIARRIRALVDSQQPLVYEPSPAGAAPVARPAHFGDFAILFRALSNVEVYEAALRQYGIDYYLVGGHAFYAQQEIFDLLNLLRVLDSRADLVSLAAVLRSGFFSLADETLFWLSADPGGLAGGLFARSYAVEIARDQQARARFAAGTLTALRDSKDRLRISELIEQALERTGYDAVLLNEFLGERKLANLRKLVDQARSFERGGRFGLADFIAQLSQFVARQPDEALAATQAEDANVVRLMTIHQSKGLEFPVVVVPDLSRRPHDAPASAHFDDELGPLVRLRETGDGPPAAGGYEFWRFLERAEEAAELSRLFYVATTRAADYLLLSSSMVDPDKPDGPWMELLARRFDLASGRLAVALPPDEPAPEIRVTFDEPPAPPDTRKRTQRVDVAKLVDEVLADRDRSPTSRRHVGPVEIDRAARRQYSFSRLYGTLEREEGAHDPVGNDAGLDAAATDALGLGTLVHSVLAALDFQRPGDLPDLVEVHALRHVPDDSADAAEALRMIERFAASPRFDALAQAQENHPEVEFLLAWPPHEQPLDTQTQAAASGLVIRGYLDRLYRDAAGRWHVIDFKTNRVTAASIAETAAQYEMQMLVYGLATEQILGEPPASLTLHFLRTGEEHTFAWNAAARGRVIALVERAITAAIGPQPVVSRPTYRQRTLPL